MSDWRTYYTFSDENTLLSILICTIVALIFTSYPILSIIIFKSLRSHVINRVILFVCLSSFCYNISLFFSVPEQTKSSCIAQALIRSFFNMAMTFWISVLMYISYKIFQCERFSFHMWQFHLVSWGYPLLFICISFSVGKLDTSDNSVDTICDFKPREHNKDAFFGYVVFFDVLVIFALQALNLYFIGIVTYRYYILKLMNDKTIWKIVTNLALYGFFLLAYILGYGALYSMHPSGFEVDKSGKMRLNPLERYVYVSNILIGAIFGLVFFLTSKASRNRWSKLLVKLCSTSKFEIESKIPSTSSFVINPSHFESNFEVENARQPSFEPYRKDNLSGENGINMKHQGDNDDDCQDYEGISNDTLLKEGDRVLDI
jgi:hypothetical protein